MAVLLVRHATAGNRHRWSGDDRLRPLDRRGRRQAKALVETLGAYPVSRIVSSPFLRCLQTVEPLGRKLGLPIEERGELAEGSCPAALAALLHELDGDTPVVCSHGDLILGLVGRERAAPKGSTWILEHDGTGFAPTVYLPPPR
jgi:8-oxo-dGTP diphosphatase